MTITEPMTMATDYLVAAASITWGVLLWRRRARSSRAAAWWAAGFGWVALAALAGGTVHGFRLHLGPGGEALLWRVALLAVGGFAFCAIATALAAGAPPRRRAAGVALAGLGLAVYAGAVARAAEPPFVWAIAAYAPALVVLSVQQLFAWMRRSTPSAPSILAGVAVSLAAAAVQRSGFDLHRYLNHNDLYHLVQLAGGWLFYRGGLRLDDFTARR